MQVIKIAGKVFGAKLTNAETEALTIEARKIIAAETKQHYEDIDAAFMWVLRKTCGFGEKRLKDVYMAYAPLLHSLVAHYEMEEETDAEGWLCKKMLLNEGIDISEWADEVRKEHPEWA